MSEIGTTTATGGCHCGAVEYEIAGPLRGVVNCHCGQCTRLNGHYGAHSKARKRDLAITRDAGLAWYPITDVARRGFCRLCGTPLFWDHVEQDGIGIVAGSLNPPTGLQTIGHIFVDDKADFYEICDAAPRFAGSSQGRLDGDYL